MEQQVLTSNKNSFSEFDQNKGIYDSAKKGAYIIIPLAYLTHKNLPALAYPGEIAEPLDFYSEDLSDLLLQKCKQSSGFVRRFRTTALTAAFKDFSDSISVCDSQVFIFNKGVALLAVWAVYDDARAFYEFVNPGYIGVQMTNENKPLQEKFIETLDKTIKRTLGADFSLYVGNKGLLVKEAYFLNVAYVTKRFQDLRTLDKLTYNLRRLIDLSRDFSDASEKDIAFSYGAKDVGVESYRWGCCISSQSISYIYADADAAALDGLTMAENSADALLLTILVLYQKYKCMMINDNIYDSGTGKNGRTQIRRTKREILEFKAYDTLAPSQVSRWNNICEIYRSLLEVNGINEAFSEIEEKIDLLDAEQERRASKIEGYIGTIIAAFGLISIIASVLTIIDLISSGATPILLGLVVSCSTALLFTVVFLIFIVHRKK